MTSVQVFAALLLKFLVTENINKNCVSLQNNFDTKATLKNECDVFVRTRFTSDTTGVRFGRCTASHHLDTRYIILVL